MVFGGFGYSLHDSYYKSKAEYWHNKQGDSERKNYPNNFKLQVDKTYEVFDYSVANQEENEVYLWVWMREIGQKEWILIINKRTWSNKGWNPGSIPSGADKPAIERGPAFIPCFTYWNRHNSTKDDTEMPVTKIQLGLVKPIGSMPKIKN